MLQTEVTMSLVVQDKICYIDISHIPAVPWLYNDFRRCLVRLSFCMSVLLNCIDLCDKRPTNSGVCFVQENVCNLRNIPQKQLQCISLAIFPGSARRANTNLSPAPPEKLMQAAFTICLCISLFCQGLMLLITGLLTDMLSTLNYQILRWMCFFS